MNELVLSIVNVVKNVDVIKKDDMEFLVQNSKSLSKVMESTYMWRTDYQKHSIISDFNYPTLHGKFHQAILEQKVQFDQSMYLAKDFEMKKLEIEDILLDIEELTDSKRDMIVAKKKQIELQFNQYELKNMQIAMDYRMKEVKGWQVIINDLQKVMESQGLSEDIIWSKSNGEMAATFFQSLNNLGGIKNSTDGAERNNLLSLALFAVQQVKNSGRYDELLKICNKEQLEALGLLGV